jgi:hypothetical protein
VAEQGVKRTLRKVDWEAIERDYRVGRFSLRELGEKHKASYAEIGRRAKKHSWSKDLSAAVKQATNAALIAEVATAEATRQQQQATDVVVAMAEVNKDVILGHRAALRTLQKDAVDARLKLIELGGSVADVREAATYVSALESSARTLKIWIEAERKAFSLDDDPDDTRDKAPLKVDLSLEPLEAYMKMLGQS